jgi:hypothetical protein
MHFRLSVLIALCSFFLPLARAFAADFTPPTGTLYFNDFHTADPGTDQHLQQVSGTWSISNGTYGNTTAAGSSNITIITAYDGVGFHGLGSTRIESNDFRVSARMRNQGTTDAHLVGLVYGYQDEQNYYEVVVSALGAVTVRTVMNGVAVDELCCTRLDLPRNTWFNVEVHWKNGQTTVLIDGNIATGASQPEFTSGRAGVVTHNTIGRFDNLDVNVPFGDQGFIELFDEHTQHVPFTPVSGQWVDEAGIYRNDAVQATNITLAPITAGSHQENGQTGAFTFRARMLNPYAGAGNLVGIVYNFETPTRYSEVVFSPTGVAKVNRVVNGVATTVATANYGGARNVAFDVALQVLGGGATVLVNGQRIFTNALAQPGQPPFFGVGIGLITHWAPGKFDNVQFDHGIFQGCSKTFTTSADLPTPVSGMWNTTGGTLNGTAVEQSDIVAFVSDCNGNDVGDDAGTQFALSAMVLNEYAGSGNLVGLVYNYNKGDFDTVADYYEVVFSSTGIVQVNKFIEGVRTTVATATHNVPRNTWFNVRVRGDDGLIEISVNGVALIRNLPQRELKGGSMGVITHWAKGRFDDVSLTSSPPRPPSEL